MLKLVRERRIGDDELRVYEDDTYRVTYEKIRYDGGITEHDLNVAIKDMNARYAQEVYVGTQYGRFDFKVQTTAYGALNRREYGQMMLAYVKAWELVNELDAMFND